MPRMGEGDSGPATKCRMCGHRKDRHPAPYRRHPDRGGVCNVRGCECTEYRWWPALHLRLKTQPEPGLPTYRRESTHPPPRLGEASDNDLDVVTGDIPVYCLDCRYRVKGECDRLRYRQPCIDALSTCMTAGWRTLRRLPTTAQRHYGQRPLSDYDDGDNPSATRRKLD